MVRVNVAPRNIFAYRWKKKLKFWELFQVLKILESGPNRVAAVASFSYRFQCKGIPSAHKEGHRKQAVGVFSEMYYTENFDE